jgi:hypothetical protein
MAEQDGDPWANPDLPMPSVDTGIHDLALNHDHYFTPYCAFPPPGR